MKRNLVWIRRDLRLQDNTALNAALSKGAPVELLFIFDENILEDLPKDDARVNFIHQELEKIHVQLKKHGSSLNCLFGNPKDCIEKLLVSGNYLGLYYNQDFEPYGLKRDQAVNQICEKHGVKPNSFVDHVNFHPSEVLKEDGTPYTVFTPYSKKWKARFSAQGLSIQKELPSNNFFPSSNALPSLASIGFRASSIKVKDYNLPLENYKQEREYPSKDSGSYLSPHLRFGTVSIREIVHRTSKSSEAFLNELIWREFFIQILFHFPKVVHQNFRSKYDGLKWRNNEEEFALWKAGKTGYPLVDAGMRELNNTGYMHNRVRMVTASFLCKHLLIDWRWGEAYFAEKLLDYELASNNGNWQWAASTGCDAQPYFRIFNPHSQLKRFDPQLEYCKKHVENLNELSYPKEIVEHKMARERCLNAFKSVV